MPRTGTVCRYDPRHDNRGRAGSSGAVPILVCLHEPVVECDEKRAEKVEAWLKKAMINGMDEVVNGLKADGPPVPIEVEVESGRTWGD